MSWKEYGKTRSRLTFAEGLKDGILQSEYERRTSQVRSRSAQLFLLFFSFHLLTVYHSVKESLYLVINSNLKSIQYRVSYDGG
jgi:hypothetical protein